MTLSEFWKSYCNKIETLLGREYAGDDGRVRGFDMFSLYWTGGVGGLDSIVVGMWD